MELVDATPATLLDLRGYQVGLITTLLGMLLLFYVVTRVYMARLGEAVRSLEHSNDENSSLVQIMSHDIDNLLYGIELHARHLEKQPGHAEEVASILRATKMARATARNVRRMRAAVDGIAPIEVGPVLIDDTTSDLRFLFEKMLAAKDISLLVENEMPTGSEFMAERSCLVNQLAGNLMSNAIKFSKRGGTILVEISEQAGCVRWTIADDGIGIPGDWIDRVCDFDKHTCRDSGRGGDWLRTCAGKAPCSLVWGHDDLRKPAI